MSCTFDNLPVVFELVGLQDVSSDVVLERVIVYRVLSISVRLILERAHPFRGQISIIVAPKCLHAQIIVQVLILFKIILIFNHSLALIVLLVIVVRRLVQNLMLLKVFILTARLVLPNDISALADQL